MKSSIRSEIKLKYNVIDKYHVLIIIVLFPYMSASIEQETEMVTEDQVSDYKFHFSHNFFMV